MDAINKIHEFERFGSVLGLERMTVLMEILGNPQDKLEYIHVAGTNGKGSVCRYIYEGLKGNGYKVGLYTSPFLEIFNERIEFDGQYISDEDLSFITERVLKAVDEMIKKGYNSPTEFEVTTAVAFVYFEYKKADMVVLEVGLGGIGDSTNIIKNPMVSIITSISYDHMDRLGNTLAEIAGEKAGIIKENVPIIMNVSEREAKVVIAKKAYEKGCILYDLSKIKYGKTYEGLDGISFDTMIYGTDYSGVEISMVGDHQVDNAVTALAAIEILRKARKIKIERSKLYEGFKTAKQIGRFEVLEKEPYVILDGAHNQAGTEALAKAVNKYLYGYKTLVVCGMLRDKDVEIITDNLLKIDGNFVVTEPDNPRKLKAEELAEVLKKKGKEPVFAGTPEAVCKYVNEYKNNYEAVIFAGSLYLIGQIRGLLKHGTDR